MKRNRILVADDERHIVRLIQVNLERQGYVISVAFDGNEALQRIRSELPDIAVLDADLPGISGRDIARIVSEDPDLCHIKVVLMGDRKDDGGGDGGGPGIFLTRPVKPWDFLACLTRPGG